MVAFSSARFDRMCARVERTDRAGDSRRRLLKRLERTTGEECDVRSALAPIRVLDAQAIRPRRIVSAWCAALSSLGRYARMYAAGRSIGARRGGRRRLWDTPH
ncbi:hypothetical protein B0H10DRAFT_2034294 [Mycena sp. CBHHK59/15]|nr:hypothetical protein B0H10DRAFT_2034294 [Mycena sp. CBHHK59/15]